MPGRNCCSIFAIDSCMHNFPRATSTANGAIGCTCTPGPLAASSPPPFLLVCCGSHLKCMLQVTITSPQLVTDHTNPTITVNYGGRVAQLNPLLLYNISGAARTDVVYDVNAGVVTITAYVDDATQNADIW